MSIVLKPVAGDEDTREPDRLDVRATQSTATTSDGEVFRQSLNLAGLTFVVKKSDTPCRSDEESP